MNVVDSEKAGHGLDQPAPFSTADARIESAQEALRDAVSLGIGGSELSRFLAHYGDNLAPAQLGMAHALARLSMEGEFPERPYDESFDLRPQGVLTYISHRVAHPHNDYNLRPSDPEGMPNRLHFYSSVGIEPDQVLSPVLGTTGKVLNIGKGSELVFDKTSARLLPAENDGHADGWLVTDPELANRLGHVGFVADCPMTTLVYAPPDETGYQTTRAVGMMHTGWKNVACGIGESMADVMQEQGIDRRYVYASISPGAGEEYQKERELVNAVAKKLGGDPKRVLQLTEPSEIPSKVRLNELAIARELLLRIGIPIEHILSDYRSTIADSSLHSHSRDAGTRADRPEAGRSAVLSLPRLASGEQYFREELFGYAPRGQVGILKEIVRTHRAVRYKI